MIVRFGIAIDNIPAADVRPVVLCRDCKHYNPSNRDWKCERSMGLVDPDEEDFCSLGERRESDHIADDGKKVYPCADCRWSPPSSGDGKPCCACDPDDPLMNCYERREAEE